MTWLRHRAKLLFVSYLVLLAFALLSPTSEPQSGAVVWLGDCLIAVGMPEILVTFPRLEVAMNAAVIVPVTFFGSLIVPRWSWREWVAVAFLVSVAIEITQGFMLSGRQMSFTDVVANTTGALAGALLKHVLRCTLRPIPRR